MSTESGGGVGLFLLLLIMISSLVLMVVWGPLVIVYAGGMWGLQSG